MKVRICVLGYQTESAIHTNTVLMMLESAFPIPVIAKKKFTPLNFVPKLRGTHFRYRMKSQFSD